MKLSYTSYKNYISCPQYYLWKKERKEPPEPSSKYFALYGLLIEYFFKEYTNYYTKKNIEPTFAEIKQILAIKWKNILDNNYVNWNDFWVKENSIQIYESVLEDTVKNLKAFDLWRHSRSEVTIDINLKKSGDLISSRLDFIWDKPDGTVEILDGKGTAKIDTNVDVEQLYFYALIYLLKYRKMPSKLGFLYYRYQMIKYIDFDKDILMNFKNKVVLVKKAIKNDKKFEPKVKLSKQCKWCEYKYCCDAYSDQKKKNANKRKKNLDKIDYGGGLFEFSPESLR